MMDYKWGFGPAEVSDDYGLKQVVKIVMWTLTATDGERSCCQVGRLALPEPDPIAFVPFEKLTKDVVYKWVTENPAVNVSYTKALLAAEFKLPVVIPIVLQTLPLPFEP